MVLGGRDEISVIVEMLDMPVSVEGDYCYIPRLRAFILLCLHIVISCSHLDLIVPSAAVV